MRSMLDLLAYAQSSSSQINATYTIIGYFVFFLIIILLSLPGFQQKMYIYFVARDIENGLVKLENFSKNAKKKTVELLKKNGAVNADELTEKFAEWFTIDPVNVEPTDIISRMRLLIRTSEDKIKQLIMLSLPNLDPVTRSKIEVSAEIVNALNMIYKVIRHYLILGKKLQSYFILVQLQSIVPMLVKMAEAYEKAQDVFLKGIPVGDSLGPLVASRFLVNISEKWSPSREMIAGETEFEGRRLIVLKAEGPMATVGTPGEAVENVVSKLGGKVSRIITVDAAAKLEGEQTGSIAEGTGVAMGDPGPEKIAIERVAVKYNIPIDALIVKMSMEEAITEMPKEVYEAADKVVEMVKQLIKQRTQPGDTIILVGVGNTVGVAQ
ncbi:DUF1512 domain-containing protein [Sulfolobus sp. S-194]|uniref:DUF1512 domain-containing protein n=1 Tax=Sulfolobus sp. S-194 TaxID=2512240 RepID=UPI001436EE81|nr:DUF1512 domain-containing protein [Sulfolobus sp. S-194]QIW24298.1 DUF1512 domain-containing protein [Sulfolobus sp. S-194]